MLAALRFQKRLGDGMEAKSSLAGRIFLLAAIIYVNDTDLLHWAKFYGISDDEFKAQIQQATTDWGMLVIKPLEEQSSHPKASGI